jgi:hypothetical protein
MAKDRFNSGDEGKKMDWRALELIQVEKVLGSIPKGQVYVSLTHKFMKHGKIDPKSEVGMGIRLGIFSPKQVVSVDMNPSICVLNHLGNRQGVSIKQGDLAHVVKRLVAQGVKIAWVSADLMAMPKKVAPWIASIMESLNTKGQPEKAGLFVNAVSQSHAYDVRHTTIHKVMVAESEEFRAAYRKSSCKPSEWQEEDCLLSHINHRTAKEWMQSALYIKTPNKGYNPNKKVEPPKASVYAMLKNGQKKRYTRIVNEIECLRSSGKKAARRRYLNSLVAGWLGK